MALTIRTLTPEAQRMLDAYMESNDIAQKTTAINCMLEDHKEFNTLKMKNNLAQEEELKYKYRYLDLLKSVQVLKAHLKGVGDE